MSNKKLAVIMDPIQNINPHKDSSLAMLLEAQKRGYEIYCGDLADIWLDGAMPRGRLTKLKVFDDTADWFEIVETVEFNLGELDVILMRKDPPFDIQYVFSTYVLEQAERHGTLIVNRPQGLRDANEKAFVAWFPDCVPATLITRSLDEMSKFIAIHEKVVVKPLDLMGGRSVFSTAIEDGNHNVIFETVSDYGRKYTVLQQYIPEIVESGDRRILLIDGEPIPFALARIPAPGDHRGNIDAGARIEVHPLTDREWSICKRIGPLLREKGLLFTGIDIIGDYMTELNVTSPTGIRELERESGLPIAEKLFDSISSHCQSIQHTSERSVL
ncbi:MAG: glutathione synthase [Mariniblastus sp.]|nr:glutathione synthase [Mariniblastus sp.]